MLVGVDDDLFYWGIQPHQSPLIPWISLCFGSLSSGWDFNITQGDPYKYLLLEDTLLYPPNWDTLKPWKFRAQRILGSLGTFPTFLQFLPPFCHWEDPTVQNSVAHQFISLAPGGWSNRPTCPTCEATVVGVGVGTSIFVGRCMAFLAVKRWCKLGFET